MIVKQNYLLATQDVRSFCLSVNKQRSRSNNKELHFFCLMFCSYIGTCMLSFFKRRDRINDDISYYITVSLFDKLELLWSNLDFQAKSSLAHSFHHALTGHLQVTSGGCCRPFVIGSTVLRIRLF